MKTCIGILFLCLVAIDGSPLPDSNTTTTDQGVCGKDLIKTIKDTIEKTFPTLQQFGDIPAYAATSCQQIANLRPQAQSGHYWIQGSSSPTRVYCVIGGGPCGEGVWMQVANVNMTETSSSCPPGLERITLPKSVCRKTYSSGCSSAKFSTHGITFNKVCGQVIGVQYHSPDAFYPYYANQGRTLDDLYVDGVSITHSSQPRQHIWTFAAAINEVPGNNAAACPCMNSKSHVPFNGLIPEFIGNDFFCETGSRTSTTSRSYTADPLWDGKGCGRYSTCCEGEGKPWFHKTLPQPVTSDIEARICDDSSRSSEDIYIEKMELYVQ